MRGVDVFILYLHALGELAGLAKSILGEGSLPHSDVNCCVLAEYISVRVSISRTPVSLDGEGPCLKDYETSLLPFSK